MRMAAIAMGLAAASGTASAEDGRFEFRSENMIARSDPFAPDDELVGALGAPFDLETGFDSNNWGRWVQPLSGRQVVRFEQQLRVRSYFDRDELNSVLLTPRVQYWNTSADNRFQFRIYGAFSHLIRDGEAQWNRPETEAQLRWRHDGERRLETVFRVRVNAYDFQRDGLEGLDSTRVRFGVEQFFRPDPERVQLRLSAFHETADADDDAFSFEEVRVRAELTVAVDEKTTFGLRADFRDRDYDAPFSAAFPERRADERFLAEAHVERRLSERVTAFAAGGYLENASNISTRDYDGGVFRVGFRFEI